MPKELQKIITGEPFYIFSRATRFFYRVTANNFKYGGFPFGELTHKIRLVLNATNTTFAAFPNKPSPQDIDDITQRIDFADGVMGSPSLIFEFSPKHAASKLVSYFTKIFTAWQNQIAQEMKQERMLTLFVTIPVTIGATIALGLLAWGIYALCKAKMCPNSQSGYTQIKETSRNSARFHFSGQDQELIDNQVTDVSRGNPSIQESSSRQEASV